MLLLLRMIMFEIGSVSKVHDFMTAGKKAKRLPENVAKADLGKCWSTGQRCKFLGRSASWAFSNVNNKDSNVCYWARLHDNPAKSLPQKVAKSANLDTTYLGIFRAEMYSGGKNCELGRRTWEHVKWAALSGPPRLKVGCMQPLLGQM